MVEHIAIEELLPHTGPMLLVDRVLQSEHDYVVCALEVRSDGLFDTDNQVPALLGLEYMAQTIATFSGLQARQKKEKPRLGFLLGARKFSTNVAQIRCGTVLTISAHLSIKTSDGMAAFECTLVGDNIRQTATLTVFEPLDAEQFLEGGTQ